MKNKQILLKTKKKTVDLEQFAGEWVALINNNIVSHNKILENLMKEVKKQPLKENPSVLLVPRKDEGPYIL
jgi:hypothetical protein